MNIDLSCSVCGKPVKWKGLCKKHYYDNYNLLNKEKIKESNKKYKIRYYTIGPLTKEEKELKKKLTKEKEKETTKRYIENNREKIRKLQREWKQKNWGYIKQRLQYKYKNNITYKLSILYRNSLSLSLRKYNAKKNNLSIKYLGCSIQQLKDHLEKQFKPGMSWENHNFRGWHIDHIIPISSFDLLKEEEKKKCFHYTNLQPLWMYDNLSKNNKIVRNKNE